MVLIVTDFRAVPSEAKGCAVALGNFDGVHAGHQAVIGSAAKAAEEKNVPLAALVFEPPPRRFFAPDSEPFRIMRPEKRRQALADLGVSVIFELPFNAEMAGMGPDEFIQTVLVDGLNLSHLSVGFDFRFGRGREGDTFTLQRAADEKGFSLSVMDRVTDGTSKVSSTAIRQALQDGQPDKAAQLLGHYWCVDGVIEHGEKRGRTIGFPTANLKLGNLLNPRHGVYAVWMRLDGEGDWIGGVANFGRTPTTGIRDPLLEVYLFGFSGELYDTPVEIALVSFLRDEHKFDSLEAMTHAIADDVQNAMSLLKDMADQQLRISQLPLPNAPSLL
ncbi:MAG: bifunctional riboflavin kinase/FMN adenylyltransferase [Ponticaulis sp.]|nr:bifunctional riboflavin kinase/FMN adenylyltransferase [Ponticaulis sp.]